MDNQAIKKLESDLWESADLLRAGSKLTSQLLHCTGSVEGYKLYKNSAWKVFGDKSSTKNSHVDQTQLVLDFEGLGTTIQTDEEFL